MEPRAVDGERRVPSVASILAPMRSSGSITRRMGRRDSEASPISRLVKRMARHDAGEEPHRRPRVAGVQRPGRRQQAANAAPLYKNTRRADTSRGALGHFDPQLPQTRQGRPAVGTWRKIGQRRASMRKRSEEGITVRNRLVAGHAQAALHPARSETVTTTEGGM